MGLPATTSFMKWTSSEGNKRGTGTSGMTTHIQNSCQAERFFSALAALIGYLRSNMLASKVERMMFIRLNRHLVETRSTTWTPQNAQARARVAKSAQNRRRRCRRGQACRLTLPYRCYEWPCEWYTLSIDLTRQHANGVYC